MNESSSQDYITIKVYRQTRKKLLLLTALTDKRMAVMLDELVSRELEKVQKQNKAGK